MGERVTFSANGGTAEGYLAEPEGDGPGIVVLQEWWGLVPEIKGVCDRFAEEGFLALAPDLYHGDTTDQPDEAQQKLMALNIEEAEKEMRGAVRFLLDHPKSNGEIGSVGFCMGGGLAIWAAATNPDIGAAVSYYYVLPHGKPDFSKINGPVQGHFGTSDDFIPLDDAKALENEIRDAGNDVEFHYYDGAGHAFSNEEDRIGTHHPEHANKAWDRTVDFFKRHLTKIS